MKNKILLYVLIIGLSSFNCWSLQSQISLNEKKLQASKNSSSTTNAQGKPPTKKIKYYHVEETVTLKFGGYKTVYDVINPNIINTYDLGPNGSRTITPVYEDEVQIQHEEPTIKSDTVMNIKKPASISISDAPKKKDSYAYIDVIKTYERVADKGYESVDMLKKVGNSYFFNDEFEKAEKCYSKLFSITTDVEPEYYYRYSITLKSMGNIQKSDEFLKKFNQLSSVKPR
ncbi:hypothetical protein [Flavobacterium sp. 5]|uniref:hypothetical protein n=1 Tax=Flavobacterium sp. 5 TaxID=2035199 RepID=UPI000C2C6212|nr:hypothetical protein [Flavobacterium sp. 5]PKB18925.1 hypothetical protein CLU82_4226 [Flavobacterium sp. 5]